MVFYLPVFSFPIIVAAYSSQIVKFSILTLLLICCTGWFVVDLAEDVVDTCLFLELMQKIHKQSFSDEIFVIE